MPCAWFGPVERGHEVSFRTNVLLEDLEDAVGAPLSGPGDAEPPSTS